MKHPVVSNNWGILLLRTEQIYRKTILERAKIYQNAKPYLNENSRLSKINVQNLKKEE